MGNFYTNFCLRGVTQQAVAAALKGRRAFVSPVVNSVVVVFDKASDSQDERIIRDLGAQLSKQCACPVLAALNHDDDILWLALFTDGNCSDEYNSSPAYFDDSAESDEPTGGDAAKLAQAFAASAPQAVEKVLRAPADDYTFAIERHAALVVALSLPPFAVGGGYKYISSGAIPEGLSKTDLIHTA